MKMYDFGNKIVAHLVDEETLLPLDLTDKTALLIIKVDGEVIQKDMLITDVEGGIAEYTIEEGLLVTYGNAEIEVRVEGTGVGVTSEDVNIQINNTNYEPPEE
jgi:hypothetical protein